MEVLLLAVMGAVNVACFVIGAKVGQAVAKGEKVQMPSMNPMAAYREQQVKKQAQKEQDRIATIMRNVESYDGTGNGQKDVPGR